MTETKGGVYIDLKTQKVVKAEPEEGIQLAAPGQEITPEVQAAVDRHETAVKGVPEVTKTAKAEK